MKAILSVLFGVLSYILGDAQVPKLSSYPAAQGVLFLDFDGQYVQGTSWNWEGPIAAQASGLSSAAARSRRSAKARCGSLIVLRGAATDRLTSDYQLAFLQIALNDFS